MIIITKYSIPNSQFIELLNTQNVQVLWSKLQDVLFSDPEYGYLKDVIRYTHTQNLPSYNLMNWEKVEAKDKSYICIHDGSKTLVYLKSSSSAHYDYATFKNQDESVTIQTVARNPEPYWQECFTRKE